MKVEIEKYQKISEGEVVGSSLWMLNFGERAYSLTGEEVIKLHYELGQIVERYLTPPLEETK